MRLLYLSAHSILEFDELCLFEELGIDYFSLGSYIDPKKPADPIRPALSHVPDQKLYTMLPKDKDMLTIDFLKNFDVVVVMHVPEWIYKNAKVFEEWGGRVIWRTIGQSTPAIENSMQQYKWLDIVRYSPKEQNIDYYAGGTVIRFYKDSDEFIEYNGKNHVAITFSQDMKQRAEFCNYEAFMKIAEGLPVKVYGPKNENMGELNGGFLSYKDMRKTMRDSRVYIYTGTQPASYTLNFIEAMMTGIPMVCLGDKYANSMRIAGDTYEIPDIIVNGVNGFVSDDINELRSTIEMLLKDQALCKKIGKNGRQTAIDLFDKELIKKQWAQYLVS